MMKRTLVAALVAVGIGAVNADQLRDNVGIGLGTMIFEGQTGLVQQVLAATTNGSCGNQTFAISSGTLGAQQPASIVQNRELREFVAGNMQSLARDIAIGRGESLDTLAELMEVSTGERDAFAHKLQANFSRIYPKPTVTDLDVLRNLETVCRS